jgi:hypothetical protein
VGIELIDKALSDHVQIKFLHFLLRFGIGLKLSMPNTDGPLWEHFHKGLEKGNLKHY